MIFDTKQGSVKSFLKVTVSWEKHLDTTKAVCVWVAKDMRPIFLSYEILKNLHKLNAIVYLKVYFVHTG